jgi:hypothetical protein
MGVLNVDKLNAFLRGEISAVETYKMALEKVEPSSGARGTLEMNRRSHEERVGILRNEIQTLGGDPATSSGAWGGWAKLIEGGARILGDKATIAALEEGEDHGLKEYRLDDKDLDPALRQLVVSKLLPKQQETHGRMSSLKKQFQG